MRDHSVSGEEFRLIPMENGELFKTDPQPSADLLPKYYQSEDYISHTDGARNLFEKSYQLIKRVALRKKVALIDSLVKKPGELLDLGCGTGDFLLTAKQGGWKTFGTEPGDAARKLAQSKGLEVSLDSQLFAHGSFDIITMWHVLEHVPDPDSQMREILRLLRSDGYVLIAVPNFKSHDAKHYGRHWAAYDVPRHLWHFSRKSIDNLARRHGMEVTKVLPMWFDAFYVSLLSEKHKTGSMNVFSGFWRGLASNFSALQTGECSSQIYILKRK